MADVDTRLGRQSATCILLPFMLIGVTPDTAGVSKLERQGVTWSYAGIEAGAAAIGGAIKRLLILGVGR